MLTINRGLQLFTLLMLVTIMACKKDWGAHNEVTDERLNMLLSENIAASSQLSKFNELLQKTPYAGVVASSKNFTVFAPTNDALASLDPNIVSDTAKLNRFVANHIAETALEAGNTSDTIRLMMLNGKYQNLVGSMIESANMTTTNQIAKNGVLHIIDKALPVTMNIWDYVVTPGQLPDAQSTLMKELEYEAFDPNLAEQIGVDPVTGEPIYKPGTGIVIRNSFWDKVYDLRKEQEQFTLFVVEDAAFNNDIATYEPYYVTGTADSTHDLAGYAVVKDLAVSGYYTLAMLPDTLITKSGVKLAVNKSSIVRTIKASNGVIYVMSSMPVTPEYKFQTITIQAENYNGTSHDRRGNTYFRDRINPLTGMSYSDVLVSGHGVAKFYLSYRLREVPTIKYDAYWVAVNDFQSASFKQRLAPGLATSTALPETTVDADVFSEVYLGEFSVNEYNAVYNLFLVAANSTSSTVNPLVCDYIKLVPKP